MDMVRRSSLTILFLISAAAVCLILACTRSWDALPDTQVVKEYEHCKSFSESPQLVFVPGFGQASILVEDCNRYRREKVAIAMQTFEVSWYRHFGRSPAVEKVLRNLIVIFGQEEKRVRMAFDAAGVAIQNPTLSGETITKDMVWILSRSQRICDTSFIHELVHIGLWAEGWDRGDPDHLGKSYYGWSVKHDLLIQEVNGTLCVLGI